MATQTVSLPQAPNGVQLAGNPVASPARVPNYMLPKDQQTPGTYYNKPAPAVVTSTDAQKKVDKAVNDMGLNTTPQPKTTPTTKPTPEAPKAPTGEPDPYEVALNARNAEIDADTARTTALFETYQTGLDQDLQNQLNDITSQYAQRAAEMKDVNAREAAGYTMAGVRSGRDRYAPEVQQGILSTQEASGIKRLAELSAEQARIINQARSAYEAKKFDVVLKIDEIRQNNEKEKMDVIQNLHTLAQQKSAFDLQQKQYDATANRQQRTDLQNQINQDFKDLGSKAIDGLPDEVVRDMEAQAGYQMGYLKHKAEALKALEGLQQDGLLTVAAGSTVIDKRTGKPIYTAPMKEGEQPAAVKEYQFYQALSPAEKKAYDAYQTADANRKAISTDPLIAQGRAIQNQINALQLQQLQQGGGEALTPKQIPVFNSLVDKLNKSPLMAANDRTLVLKTVSQQLEQDPTNASLQISFIYSLVQALDTYQSSVREGEIGLVSGTQGLGDKLANLPEKIQSGSVLSKDKIKEYINTGRVLTDAIQAGAKAKIRNFEKQAEISGIGKPFKDFTSTLSASSVNGDVEKIIKDNPEYGDYADQIQEALKEGRSPDEILNFLKKKPSEVSYVPSGGGARTDRHNNPTAFTVDVAKTAGLTEGVDYTVGDAFPDNPKQHTALLIGDPIDKTIDVIDKIGFYTKGGQQRWTHTAMPKSQWDALDHAGKARVIAQMYRHEGGSGSLIPANLS